MEEEIFKRRVVNFKKLINYGFKKEHDVYRYSKIFMSDFRIDITVSMDGLVTGKLLELNTNEEYNNFRIEKQTGKFVNHIREEYKSFLQELAEKCFEKIYFITEQGNRIADKIIELYQDYPEFIWDKFPGYGVFRNFHTKKWYALIMNIDKHKLDKNTDGEIEAMNLKLSTDKISHLLGSKGFYPAYHMNKKNWITIILDNTITDDKIMDYIKESYQLTEISK